MTPWLAGAATALWLGLLTAISPCPLATNIAAISYLGRQTGGARVALLRSLSYVVGRCLAYAVVAGLIVAGILAIPGTSHFLERFMNRLLGPVLVLVGAVLLDLLPLPFATTAGSDSLRAKLAASGYSGSLALGGLFALSFCPVSGALYFGSLIPLALQHSSPFAMPIIFGVGSGVPVLLLGTLMAVGSHELGAVLHRVEQVQGWVKLGTGLVFVAVGIILTVQFVFLA